MMTQANGCSGAVFFLITENGDIQKNKHTAYNVYNNTNKINKNKK